MGRDAQISRLAARQRGVFNRRQARAAGFDYNAIQRRLDSSAWIQLDPSVYCFPSAEATWERQLWAAYLSRPRALVGGASAAYLHGVRGFRRTRPVIVIPGSANARSALARMIRSHHFDEISVRTMSGFQVTTVAETLVCLAADLSPQRLQTVLDDCLLAGKLEVSQLMSILDRESGRRRKGIVLMRELAEARLPTAPTVGSSYLEGMLETVLRRGGLPSWTREHPFAISGNDARVDAYVPSWRLVIEADGRNWHMRLGDFETDRARDNALAAQGIQVLRFTYGMLSSDPEDCLQTITLTGRVRSA